MSEVTPGSSGSPRPLRVVLLAAELDPVAKVGGLADVVAALSAELARLGARVTVCLPAYRRVLEGLSGVRRLPLPRAIRVPAGPDTTPVGVYEWRRPDSAVRVLLLDHPESFDRPGIYDDPVTHEGYADNDRRYLVFQRGCLEVLKAIDLRPDIFHLNDYQTSLVPAYLRTIFRDDPFYRGVGTLLTIHNLGYQGIFPASVVGWAGLPEDLFYPTGPLEFWGRANFLKAGIVQADRLSTVSPNYAREIQSGPEFGFGLEGVLRERSADLTRILNGVDYRIWNPATDATLPQTFTADDLGGKAVCKAALLERVGLPAGPAPVLGVIGRLVDQKGIDLLMETASPLLNEGFRLVVLGSGQRRYEEFFEGLKHRHPEQVAYTKSFDDTLAHWIEAGSDFFLMPSRYEPCGLNQIMSLRYGTLPIVRETGGFVDTVEPAPAGGDGGTGFLFRDYTAESLLGAARLARQVFEQPERLLVMRRRAMQRDFSWENSARQYLDLYRTVMAQRAGASVPPGPDAVRTAVAGRP